MNSKINRRQFVKTSAAVAVTGSTAMTTLKLNATNTNFAKNVIFFYVPSGAPSKRWAPTVVGGELQMNECTQPYESIKQHCVFFDQMQTQGSQGVDLGGLKYQGTFKDPNLIEAFIKEFGGYYALDFLPITSTQTATNSFVNGAPLESNPWKTYDLLQSSQANPFNKIVSENFNQAQTIINTISNVNPSEVIRYQNMLNTQKTKYENLYDLTVLPAETTLESYSTKTDFQIINMVSAFKTNKTNIIHFMTGTTDEQSVIVPHQSFINYHVAIHNGWKDNQYVVQRREFDQKVADLIKQLKDTNDSNGESLLDSTLVVLYSNEGDGDVHDPYNSPYMLAGGAFLNGGQVSDISDQDRFLDTIVQLMNSKLSYRSELGPISGIAVQ
ncbi:twin-arginine translocation signal domain-containing protein [Marinicellulosiphila megalodicopiae]|uniref:twin-arginine translocation signal domain-containing protein n=1 Tax=Marinicellulosiphila megalodicopiae TaxID=2724896 RepID=UPI003BB15E98